MNDIILRNNARQIQQMEENLIKSAKSLDDLKKSNEQSKKLQNEINKISQKIIKEDNLI